MADHSAPVQPATEPAAAQSIAVYPIFLTGLDHLVAVVVGGGPVGERKVRGLLAAGATVRLISPAATPALQQLANEGQLTWLDRPYQCGDLAEAALVFAATNQRQVNAQVAADARADKLLCNVADAPTEGNFHVPALHHHPPFTIAVGSGGLSPKATKAVRDQIAQALMPLSRQP